MKSMEDTGIIREYYNASVQNEWNRLLCHPIEFAVTKHYLDTYIKPGDRVLDIGGGPGRYALYLAEKGCDVTLLDISEENIRFAKNKSLELNLSIRAVQGDAREADRVADGFFDCILLMGPLYHLLEQQHRTQAVNAALKLLKPGGILFVSFISLFAGIVDFLDDSPERLLNDSERAYIDSFLQNTTYCGDAFTKSCFMAPKDILPFMEQFELEKLRFFGQEGVTAPGDKEICACEEAVVKRWTEIAIQTCEREEFLSYATHLMYVGRRLEPGAKGKAMNILIRNAVLSDREKIRPLQKEIADLHFRGRPDLFKKEARYFTDESFQERLDNPDDFVFIAENGKEVVGYAFASVIRYRGHATYRDFDCFYIDDICVLEKCHHQGIGTLLFDKCRETARELHCHNIDLGVWSFNESAIAFYRKHGMTERTLRMELKL